VERGPRRGILQPTIYESILLTQTTSDRKPRRVEGVHLARVNCEIRRFIPGAFWKNIAEPKNLIFLVRDNPSGQIEVFSRVQHRGV
jgi:hypothetical protein